MKPENNRPALLLPDGYMVRCHFVARGEGPYLEECEQWATENLGEYGEAIKIRRWIHNMPRSIILVRPGPLHLCDAHLDLLREMI